MPRIIASIAPSESMLGNHVAIPNGTSLPASVVGAGPGPPTSRSGESCTIASTSASMTPPTTGSLVAAGGQSQNRDRPTTRSPGPTAKSASVVAGEIETTRWAAAASGAPVETGAAQEPPARPGATRASAPLAARGRHVTLAKPSRTSSPDEAVLVELF